MTLETLADTKPGKWVQFGIPTPLEELGSLQDIREQWDGVTWMRSFPCSQHSKEFLEFATASTWQRQSPWYHPMRSSFPRDEKEPRRSGISQETPGSSKRMEKRGGRGGRSRFWVENPLAFPTLELHQRTGLALG